MHVATWSKKWVNAGLRPFNIQVVRGRSADPAARSFISARKTVAAAERSGLSVGEYVDATFSQPGTTGATVEAMIRIGDLVPDRVQRVCEIGPGTGRYLEKVVEALHPEYYEIYETADDWVSYLRKFPGLIVRECDARTLKDTETGSVDLVHAQKVFVYLEFWASAGYLAEMARVVRPGGVVAFDIVTEECVDEETLEGWLRSGTIFHPMPKEWTVSFLGRRGLEFLGSQLIRLTDGSSELMVFRRAVATVEDDD
jgi:SAM-dependent methyltransferase